MFLPGRNTHQERDTLHAAYRTIEGQVAELLPDVYRNDCQVSIQQVECGDPYCAPIDTLVTLDFARYVVRLQAVSTVLLISIFFLCVFSGAQGFLSLPMEAKDVTVDILRDAFPTKEVLGEWHAGREAEWPPVPEPVALRFSVGTFVECRTGPHEWSPGIILQQWYREANWQPGMMAPYKIRLDDGRHIFAPQDVDMVIRLRQDGDVHNLSPAERTGYDVHE